VIPAYKLSGHERKLIHTALETNRPELFRRCYPRIYEEPACGSYYSPKEVAFQMMATALRVEHEGMGGESQTAELVWASRMATLRVPIYWIGHDMSQAIQQTVPPVEFDWAKTPLPFDAMAFMVPKGTLPHVEKDEGEAMFVAFVRAKSQDEIPTLATMGPRHFTILGDALTCFVMTDQDVFLHWTYSTIGEHEIRKGKVNLAALDELVQDFARLEHGSSSMYSSSLTLNDNRYMAKVSHFIFGTLLMMLTKPDAVTTGRLRNRVEKKGVVKEFWSPNVIGLNYRIRHVPLGGTHASPRFHWVRGAFKEQPYGERNSLRKRIWIEPYTRGIE
jgi:hypothetical protein